MTNHESRNTIQQGLEDISQRLSIIQEWKNSILNLLNNLEENYKILMKIRTNQIISKKEHKSITDYIHICAYQSRPVDILNIIRPKDTQDHSKTIREIYPFVKDYPFIVDADEVRQDIWSILGEWIAEIRKNWKWWLVRKGEATWVGEMMTLFDPKHWIEWWVLTFSEEEYKKYGLIEVRHYKDKINSQSYNIMFLKKIQYPNPKYDEFYFENIWYYDMLQGFDRDGIWFNYLCDWLYKLIHKEISPQWIKIYEIWVGFKSTWYDIRKWFDSFNTFEAIMWDLWKVTFKKSYDDSWKLIWIYAFKKKRFGWEEQVRARDKEH